jgi:chromosome partitioning protein
MAQMQSRPPVLVVYNHKGGVGKTTVAINLAVIGAAAGRRVLLVDLDAQGTATMTLGHPDLPEMGAMDAMLGRTAPGQARISTVFDGLSLLPATGELRLAELQLGRNDDDVAHLGLTLPAEAEAAGADLVVIDCPPCFGLLTLNALMAATAVLIPTSPDPAARAGLSATLDEIERLQQEAHPELSVAGIVPVLTGPEKAAAHGLRLVRAAFGALTLGADIPRDGMAAVAAERLTPLVVLAPNSPAGRALIAMGGEILARVSPDPSPDEDPMARARARLQAWHKAELARPSPPYDGPLSPQGGGRFSLFSGSGAVWVLAALASGVLLGWAIHALLG